MALLPPFMLDAVVAIGSPSADGPKWNATGFLYADLIERLPDDMGNYVVFLVTNRHVLADESVVVLRFNPDDINTPARHFDMPLVDSGGKATWMPHPDPAIDVAIAHINVEVLRAHGIYGQPLFSDQDHVITSREHAAEIGLSEGDGCFVLGFPMGRVGGDRSFVVVRSGAIARIRDWIAGSSTEILIDANVFPGNSGGPVLVRPEAVAIVGTKQGDRARAIGVVSEYLTYEDFAMSAQTGRVIMRLQENSGLASVVPFEFVLETIRIFRATNAGHDALALTPHPDKAVGAS